MSVQDIPEIPGIDPAAVATLTRHCAGENGTLSMTRGPVLVDIGDDIYVIFTDGATAVMVQLEGDVLPDLPSGDEYQEQLGRIMQKVGSDYGLYYEDVDVAAILAWAGDQTHKCPRCRGASLCMYPRHGSEADKRENPDVRFAHTGWLEDVIIDRRRIQLPLQALGVDEGVVDVVVVNDPGGDDRRLPDGTTGKLDPMQMVAIIGEGWRIYSAGLAMEEDDEPSSGKHPRLGLSSP